jgi:hypothetical protein
MSDERERSTAPPMNTDGKTPDYLWSAQGVLLGQPTITGFGAPSFYVMEMDRDDANRIIVNNHYSGKFYSASYIHLGLYADACLRGVLQFGYAMNPQSMASVVEGTKIDEYLELNRMWVDDAMPRNSESKALSYAVKFIRRKYPRVAWIQSFADERCGRLGVVYQASSFLYCGEHLSTFWELDGVWYHNSLMTRDPKLSKSAAFIQNRKSECKRQDFRQFRYVKPLKNWARKRLLLPVLPYPKPDAGRAGLMPAGESTSR